MKCTKTPIGQNGKPSSLFEHYEQKYDRDTAIYVYGLVRDKEFTDFMGDWMNSPEEYTGELGASGEPTEADVEKFMRAHNAFMVSPNTSSHKARPKFQRLIEAKQVEFKEISGMMSRLSKVQANAKTPQEKVDIGKKLLSLRDKHDAIETDILNLSRLSAIEDIEDYAEKDMQELRDIFSKDEIDASDLQRALRIADLWIKAGDFSNKEHLFFDEIELEEALNGEMGDISEKFTKWAKIAMAFKQKHITPMSEAFIRAQLKETFGEDTEFDPNAPISDKDFLTTNFLDIAETDSVLLQGMAHWVKRSNYDAQAEARRIFKKIEELAEGLSAEDFRLLQQTVSNDDDRLTGNITHRYSQAYFDKMKAMSLSFASRVNNMNIKDKKEFYRLLSEEYKQLYKDKASTQVAIDPRILFFDAEHYGGKQPTQDQKDKHIEYLKKHLGEGGFNELYARAEQKIEKYNFDLETKKLELQDLYADELSQGDDGGYELELKRWKYNNSPYLAAQFLYEGYKPSAEKGIFIRPEKERYLVTAPRRVNYKGENTGMYDQRYEQIESNPQLLEFYNYALETLNSIKKFLPGYQTKHLQINALPTIKTTVMEEYIRDGVGAGLAPLMDALAQATRTDDLATEISDVDPLTQEPRKELQTQFLSDPGKEIKDYVERKKIEYQQQFGSLPQKETIREWKREKADQMAKEKSWDIVKVIKAFSMMGLTYKHKAVISDQMRIAQQLIEEQFEIVENAAGDPVKDKFGNLFKRMKSLKNTKEMVDYFMNTAFWGYPKHKPEGQAKSKTGFAKTYTRAEKQVRKDLEDMIAKNQEQFDSGEITEDVYTSRKDLLQDQLEVLGGIRTASKYGDLLLKYVGLKGLGWNVFAGAGNIGFGLISNLIEAADGRQFSVKNYFKAMWILRHSGLKNATFNHYESDTARKIRTLMDRLDILKEIRNELYSSSESSSKFSKAKKSMKWLDPYNVQARTEYINQSAMMVAMMLEKQVQVNGETKSLWDAYNADGNLVEGAEFTEEEEFKLKVKIDKMIKGAHGNYDTLDAPIKLKESFFGRAFSQFRTWAFMGFANRFQAYMYDHQLEMARKGRYRSIIPFIREASNMMKQDGGIEGTVFILKQLLKKATFGYYNAEFDRMEGLSELDRANMRKNLMELAIYMTLTSVGLLFRGLAKGMDDDDPERAPLYFSINLLSRLQTDILFYANPVEFEKLQRNALPIFSLVSDSYKAVQHSMNLIQRGEDELQSGPDKGHSKTMRAWLKVAPGPVQYYKIKAATNMLYDKSPGSSKKDKDQQSWWEKLGIGTSESGGYRIGYSD